MVAGLDRSNRLEQIISNLHRAGIRHSINRGLDGVCSSEKHDVVQECYRPSVIAIDGPAEVNFGFFPLLSQELFRFEVVVPGSGNDKPLLGADLSNRHTIEVSPDIETRLLDELANCRR